MNARRTILTVLSLLIVFTMIFGSAVADEGLIMRRNISKTPPLETAKASIFMMDFYVPSQRSTGEVGAVTNYTLDDCETNEDGTTVCTELPDRDYAKPLVSVYIDGPSTHTIHEEEAAGFSINGGIIFGAMDAFAGVSLDDGTTWKNTNISRSADLSSFTLANGTVYPGHVHQYVHQVFGDNIFMAWVSKYCEGGNPLYSAIWETDSDELTLDDVLYLEDLETTYGKDIMYLYDLFGVAGSQGSVDYTSLGFPEVGEIPFSCVWTARGKLIPGDDPMTETVEDVETGITSGLEATYVVWTKPERLTSGSRDANLPAVDCAPGAGCILTWQEDPDGLRPGLGLGPGEGWSGAVANAQTDIWYSYISAADFDMVFDNDETTITGAMTIANYAALVLDPEFPEDTTLVMPKPYVPMAMPTRLTDNAKCRPESTALQTVVPYCWIDFYDAYGTLVFDETVSSILTFLEVLTDPLNGGPEDGADFCSSTVPWTTGGGVTQDVCVSQDGRVMNGRVAATRVRLNLKPYNPEWAVDTDDDGDIDVRSAWVVMAAEESKALGDVLIGDTNSDGDCDSDELDCNPIDIGKNIWYYSFDMFNHPIVDQGGMLNQPAICSQLAVDQGLCAEEEIGQFFPVQQYELEDSEGALVNFGEYYLTEIARRFAVTTNSVGAAKASDSGLSAMLIYKQGIINQGGPADIMLRRTIVPDVFDSKVDNPYAYENMECAESNAYEYPTGWLYTDGENPLYLKGLCLSPAINISSPTIVECDGATSNDDCADLFPVDDDGSTVLLDETAFPKVMEWRQCGNEMSGSLTSIDGCEDNDADDQTWENPFDVAKGHRGFLDGDYVMMMYAWSPNWKSNSVGNDHYNLYVRRSFDGGLTWTTTPTEYGGEGLTATEYYYAQVTDDQGNVVNGIEPVEATWVYDAGDYEQARNVSLLTGNKVTILDPRYTPTGGMKLYSTISPDWLFENNLQIETSPDQLPYEDDLARDRSIFFIIYETGDNTTVAEGEAIPLDLFYSRGTVFGDIYEWEDQIVVADDPDTAEDETVVDERWPWLENKTEILSGEASVVANPGGTFLYNVWNQWQEEIYQDEFGVEHDVIHNSDMIFRRCLYTFTEIWTAPTATIISAPSTALATDQLTFIGAGTDVDDPDGENNIVSYDWRSSIDGYLGSGQILRIAGDQLSLGVHIISLVVTDDEGVSSRAARTILVIAGSWFSTQLPMMNK